MVFASKTQTPTFILGMVAIMKPIVILAFATRSNATVCETLGCSFATKGLRQLYLLKGLGKIKQVQLVVHFEHVIGFGQF